jgi:hypothetical protein
LNTAKVIFILKSLKSMKTFYVVIGYAVLWQHAAAARLNCMLPQDGHRPKLVGAKLM